MALFESDFLLDDEDNQDQTGEVADSGLSNLESLRARLMKREEESAAEEEKQRKVLEEIQAAKLKLLEAPSRREALMGLAQKLTAPKVSTDPRFFERQNLYTFLRDVGEYGGEQKQAEKERQAKIAELKEKYATEALSGAQASRTRAQQLAAQYLSDEPKAEAGRATSEFERLIADLPPDEQVRMRRQRAEVLASRAPKSEKAEPDPNRPSTVVQSRVATVRDRKLGPTGEKLNAVSQAQSLLNAARTNPAAVPQVDRFLARLTGDSQLSQLEVNSIANAGSFPSRVVSSISKFLSGIPSDLSLDDKSKVLSIIEDQLAPKYNSGRENVLDTFSGSSDISQEAVERIVGPKWVTSAERRRRAEEQKRLKEERERADKAGTEGSITLSGGKSGRPVK
jgi:hypothetical protein